MYRTFKHSIWNSSIWSVTHWNQLDGIERRVTAKREADEYYRKLKNGIPMTLKIKELK